MPTGWISKRHALHGGSIGGTKGMKLAEKGPLRKILYTIRHAESMFDTKWVKFECGHEGEAWGDKQGRCRQCKVAAGAMPAEGVQ